MRVWAGALVLWTATVATAGGQTEPQQQGKPSAVAVTPPRNIMASDVQAPLIDQPLHLSDFRGMKPREELREKLGHVRELHPEPAAGRPAWDGEDRGVDGAYELSAVRCVSLL